MRGVMRVSILLILLAFSVQGFAQQIVAEVGRVNTRFNYQASTGTSNTELSFFPESGFAYTAAYRGLWGTNAAWRLGMRYQRLGQRATDPLFDRTYHWDAQYLGAHTQLDIEYLRRENLGLLWTGGADLQWLIAGQQTIGNDIYDLRGTEQFNTPYAFLHTGLQGRYCLDSHIAVTASYRYAYGLAVGAGSDPETLHFHTHTISVGLFIGFTYCKYCFKTHFI